jgi:hypothetical protein
MAANGSIMDRVPLPLRQLMGQGTAIAMSDKFDMNQMLLHLHQQQVAVGHVQAIHYQPYNFSEGSRGGNLSIQQLPFPKAEWERALGVSDIHPAVRQQLNEIFARAMGSSTASLGI